VIEPYRADRCQVGTPVFMRRGQPPRPAPSFFASLRRKLL